MIPEDFREVPIQNHIILTGSWPHSVMSPCSHLYLRKMVMNVVILAGFAYAWLGGRARHGTLSALCVTG